MEAAANQTLKPRLGVILEYAAGWLRPRRTIAWPFPARLFVTCQSGYGNYSATTFTHRSWATSTAATRAGSLLSADS